MYHLPKYYCRSWSGLFLQGNVSCYTTKIVQEWSEEHDWVLGVDFASNSTDLNLIKHVWDVLNKPIYWSDVWSMEASPQNLQEDLLSWWQMLQHTFSGLVESTWVNLHNIRQVLWPLWMIIEDLPDNTIKWYKKWVYNFSLDGTENNRITNTQFLWDKL